MTRALYWLVVAVGVILALVFNPLTMWWTP